MCKYKRMIKLIGTLIILLMNLMIVQSQTLTYEIANEFNKIFLVRTGSIVKLTQAISFCDDNGGQLAKIESADEWLWFDDHVVKPNQLENNWYWIGATPVAKRLIPSHWLDGSNITQFFWNGFTARGRRQCNGLRINSHNDGPNFSTYTCSGGSNVLCQLPMTNQNLVRQLMAAKFEIQTCSNALIAKTNEARLCGQDVIERKSTLSKLKYELMYERKMVVEC